MVKMCYNPMHLTDYMS